MNDTPDLLFVCGMHRSGTSLLAEACQLAGLGIADELIADDQQVNHRGFWEDRVVVALNEELLSVLGLHWSAVSPLPPGWLEQAAVVELLEQAANHLKTAYTDRLPAVVKDPRLCRLLPFWVSAAQRCGWTTACLLSLREPYAVASSLQKRDALPPALSALLWTTYMRDAIRDSASLPRQFIDYDELLESGPGHLLDKLSRLGLPVPDDGGHLNTAFDRSLRHHRPGADHPADDASHHAALFYKACLESPQSGEEPRESDGSDDNLAVIDALTLSVLETQSDRVRIGQLNQRALTVVRERDEQLAQLNHDINAEREAAGAELEKHRQALAWSDNERAQAAQYIETLEKRVRTQDHLLSALSHSLPGRIALRWQNFKQSVKRDNDD